MLFRSLCRIAVCQQSKICANEQVEGKVGHGEASLRHTSLFTRGREGGAKKSVTTDFWHKSRHLLTKFRVRTGRFQENNILLCRMPIN